MNYNIEVLSEGSEKIDEKPVKKLKSKRQNLPKETTAGLWDWFKDNIHHPYPNDAMKREFALKYDLTLVQVNNWFINTRRRFVEKLIKEFGLGKEMDGYQIKELLQKFCLDKEKIGYQDENMNGCPDEKMNEWCGTKKKDFAVAKNGWCCEKIIEEILRSLDKKKDGYPDEEINECSDEKMNGAPHEKKNELCSVKKTRSSVAKKNGSGGEERNLYLDEGNNFKRKRNYNGSSKRQRHGSDDSAYSSSSVISMSDEDNQASDTSVSTLQGSSASSSNRSSSPCEAQIIHNVLQSQFPFANSLAFLASVSIVKDEIEKLSI